MPTNSIIINRSVIPKLISFFETFKNVPVGDYYMQILGAENGGALYLSDVMSVYRIEVPGSWSDIFQKSSKSDNSGVDSLIVANNKMNAFTNYNYSKQFALKNNYLVLQKLSSEHIDIEIKRCLFKSHNQYLNLRDKLLWHTIFKHQKIAKALKSSFNY